MNLDPLLILFSCLPFGGSAGLYTMLSLLLSDFSFFGPVSIYTTRKLVRHAHVMSQAVWTRFTTQSRFAEPFIHAHHCSLMHTRTFLLSFIRLLPKTLY